MQNVCLLMINFLSIRRDSDRKAKQTEHQKILKLLAQKIEMKIFFLVVNTRVHFSMHTLPEPIFIERRSVGELTKKREVFHSVPYTSETCARLIFESYFYKMRRK